jgi:hypothetical protein
MPIAQPGNPGMLAGMRGTAFAPPMPGGGVAPPTPFLPPTQITPPTNPAMSNLAMVQANPMWRGVTRGLPGGAFPGPIGMTGGAAMPGPMTPGGGGTPWFGGVTTGQFSPGATPWFGGTPPSSFQPFTGMKRGGKVANRQLGGAANISRTITQMPERHMIRQMTRGALLTSSPGRMDMHRTNVASGSYVIPADVVSGRGQGNTLAGAKVLHTLFGMGPYGGGPSPLKPGRAPKLGAAPRPAKMAAPAAMPKFAMPAGIPGLTKQTAMGIAAGGKIDSNVGQPVPVNLSGGEIVVPPEALIATFKRLAPGRNYTLPQIHRMMDKWVLEERKLHRKTLGNLPPPARD